ncbi:hydroxymethylpyrimidine/phosphomethylpyrimidine kinase [Flavobacterium sp. GCM10027622]|uniref:hydroxymethylpyrimidine/phosphomethylpyrimidine kinase n=1 Tax=unclassified Flavobacterium TaxID=196869 RepID=UPI00360ED1C1
MSANRPFVLTIAGFDPSGGAGILADIKTFEQHQVYGLGIMSGNTLQTEEAFHAMHWTDIDFVLQSIQTLFKKYEIKVVKIGIMPSLEYLQSCIAEIRKQSTQVKIIWDTVLKSTTNFNFITVESQAVLLGILKQIDLITPNYIEILKLTSQQNTPENNAQMLSNYCAVLLKGGHNSAALGTDYLYRQNNRITLSPNVSNVIEKHGSGCVLSSAIAANMALGFSLETSCQKSKQYIENYLNTNNTLLGYHHAK